LCLKELTELAKSLFREALPQPFSFKYKDDEGDIISISCDRELEEAIRLFKVQGILRLIVTPVQVLGSATKPQDQSPLDDLVATFSPYIDAFETQLSDIVPKIEEQVKGVLPKIEETVKGVLPKIEETLEHAYQTQEVIHPAICDNCNERIRGIRFKCTQCPDFDLCTKCNQLKIHPEHLFQKVDKPVYCERETPRCCASAPSNISGLDEVQIPLHVVTNETRPLTPLREPVTPLVATNDAKPEPAQLSSPFVPNKEEPAVSIAFQAKLQQLSEMGFLDQQRNVTLLAKWKGDMINVVKELLE